MLDGKKNGVQIWRSVDVYRDVYSNFGYRGKVTQGLTTLINSLYAKVYGDWLQYLNLINYFNRSNIKNQGKVIRDYEGVIQKKSMLFRG